MVQNFTQKNLSLEQSLEHILPHNKSHTFYNITTSGSQVTVNVFKCKNDTTV